MIYERLVDAFDNADLGEQWGAFVAAVIAEVRAVHGQSTETIRLVDEAATLWGRQAEDEALRTHKRAVWAFLEAKNGNTTTIRDVDDRVLRALLTVLECGGGRSTAEEAADWVETVLTGFGAGH